jgi:hypothetical protein
MSQLNTLTVDQILNTYILDADKIKTWWHENIDADEDDIRILTFKNYVRDVDKPPREKSEFLLQFLLIQNGKPVLHKTVLHKTGGKRIKKRTIRRKSKRSIRRKSKRSIRRKSRKNY